MAELSENNMAYLKQIVTEGEAVVPALVYAKLRELGLVLKVEDRGAGRGRSVVVATPAGKQAVA